MKIGKNGVVSIQEITEYCLPQEYQQVEYIGATGTQYIELSFGFKPTDEVYSKFSIELTETASDKHIISTKTWNTTSRFAMGLVNGKFCCGYGNVGTSNTYMLPQTSNDGNAHNWYYKDKVFLINDLNLSKDVSSLSFSVEETSNITFFYNGYNGCAKGKLYYAKFYRNDILSHYLLPCYRKLDSVIGMYDLITKTFFTNSGTGTFTKGNNINNVRFYNEKIVTNEFIEI